METLDHFDFSKHPRYNWSLITDGRIWRLEEGQGYSNPDAFIDACRYHAKKLGATLHFKRVEKAVVVQFVRHFQNEPLPLAPPPETASSQGVDFPPEKGEAVQALHDTEN